MRAVKVEEKKKRGCIECADVIRGKLTNNDAVRTLCPYAKCPYAVLDKYETYEDYMKSEDSKINFVAAGPGEGAGGRISQGAMAVYWEKWIRKISDRGGIC